MFLLILVSTYVGTVLSQCSYNNGDISSRWQVINGELTVEFINRNIGNNQWTGIGFGPGMNNLEVVIFKIHNNRPSLVTGTTAGYGPPLLDAAANVSPQTISYNSNQLTVRFSRPLEAVGALRSSLTKCSTWNFAVSNPVDSSGFIMKHTSTPKSVTVCPQQCTAIFESRNVLNDPVPIRAIYNNRQSSRFDALHGR